MAYGKCRLQGPKEQTEQLLGGPRNLGIKTLVLLSKKIMSAHGEKAWNMPWKVSPRGHQCSVIFLEFVRITVASTHTHILIYSKNKTMNGSLQYHGLPIAFSTVLGRY